MEMNFPEFLEKRYLEWQNEQGKRKTLEEFAGYIGVSRPLLNMWMNGNRQPGVESLRLLSNIFGLEVYDLLGYERPNSFLHTITSSIS
jgi:transcriptional regulator with XRE-family HTH domain